MEQGYSTTALAGHLGVSRATIYNWADRHPEFLEALKLGEAASALWWEARLRQNALDGTGNATAAIFGLKNRARHDWRDRRETDLTSTDGSMSPKPLDLSKLPKEALEAIVQAADEQSDD
jgi:hypothetical protein